MASRRGRTAGADSSAACGRLALQACWALIGVALLSTAAAAQTAPFPALPPEPPPAPANSPDAGAGPPDIAPGEDPDANQPLEASDLRALNRPRPWEYSLGAGVGWNSNVNFDSQTDLAGSSAALSPVGSLMRIFWGPKADLRAGAVAAFVWYPNQEIKRHYINLELDGNYRSSPGTSWSIDGTFDVGNSDASRLLTDQGLLLPQVETRTFTSQLSLTQRLGTHSALYVSGRFYNLEFVDAPLYQPGRSLRGTIGVDRRLSGGDTASFQYSLEDVLADAAGRTYFTHFASLQWSHLFSPRSGILLEGGSSYTPDAVLAGLETEATFFGGVSYSRRVRQSDIRLYLRREVVPAFGFGVSRAETRAELSGAVPLGKNWRLTLLAHHVQPSVPETSSFGQAPTDQAMLSLGRRMHGKLEISANVRYRRRGPSEGVLPTHEFVGGVFLTLMTPSAKLGNRSF
jgi:hypothetical protein